MRAWLALLASASVVAAGAGAWGWNHFVAGTWTLSTVVVQVAPDLNAAERLDALGKLGRAPRVSGSCATWCGAGGTTA